MIIAKNEKVFFIKCLIYALIAYSIIICSFIMWAIDGKAIQEIYLDVSTNVYYSGKPIFNPFAIFEYQTTLNSLFIATCVLFLGIGGLTKKDFILKRILNVNIWAYISTIFVFMFIAVLFFDVVTMFEAYRELIEHFSFSFISIVQITSRFVLHHVLIFYYIWLLKDFRPIKSESLSYKSAIVIIIYYVVWYILVNIIGKGAYGNYEWYPYILIMPKGFLTFFNLPLNAFTYVVYYLGLIALLPIMIISFHFSKRLLNKISSPISIKEETINV